MFIHEKSIVNHEVWGVMLVMIVVGMATKDGFLQYTCTSLQEQKMN